MVVNMSLFYTIFNFSAEKKLNLFHAQNGSNVYTSLKSLCDTLFIVHVSKFMLLWQFIKMFPMVTIVVQTQRNLFVYKSIISRCLCYFMFLKFKRYNLFL